MDLLRWWNLIFVLPALAAVLYLLLLATGAVAADGADADLDADLDTDLDTDLDFDHGIEDVFGGQDGGAGEQQPGGLLQVLTLIGVGRVPLSLLVISFSILWGFLGWVGNQFFGTLLPSPALFVWPSLLIALVGGGALTRVLASGLSRLLPATETYAVANRQLVGRLAEVRHTVTPEAGSALLHDGYGRLHEVPVRVRPGEPSIPARRRVVLWRYDETAGAFLVVPGDELDQIERVAERVEQSSGVERSRGVGSSFFSTSRLLDFSTRPAALEEE